MTLTWAVAFPIILVLMIGFLVITSALSGGGFFNKNKINFEEGLGTRETQRVMIKFLNTHVEFEGKDMSIYRLVLSSDLDDEEISKVFNENADKIFLDEFPFPCEGWRGVHPWWIRMYNIGDEMKFTDRLRKKNFHAGAWNCNSNNFEESIVNTIIVGDKKVVFCILKSYYNLKC